MEPAKSLTCYHVCFWSWECWIWCLKSFFYGSCLKLQVFVWEFPCALIRESILNFFSQTNASMWRRSHDLFWYENNEETSLALPSVCGFILSNISLEETKFTPQLISITEKLFFRHLSRSSTVLVLLRSKKCFYNILLDFLSSN